MSEITARVTVPQSARRGEIIVISALARHSMDRAIDAPGIRPTPRRIIHTFRVRYAGEEIFRLDLSSGIASNPFVSFTTIATETGPVVFEWLEDGGAVYSRAATLVVT